MVGVVISVVVGHVSLVKIRLSIDEMLLMLLLLVFLLWLLLFIEIYR